MDKNLYEEVTIVGSVDNQKSLMILDG